MLTNIVSQLLTRVFGRMEIEMKLLMKESTCTVHSTWLSCLTRLQVSSNNIQQAIGWPVHESINTQYHYSTISTYAHRRYVSNALISLCSDYTTRRNSTKLLCWVVREIRSNSTVLPSYVMWCETTGMFRYKYSEHFAIFWPSSWAWVVREITSDNAELQCLHLSSVATHLWFWRWF